MFVSSQSGSSSQSSIGFGKQPVSDGAYNPFRSSSTGADHVSFGQQAAKTVTETLYKKEDKKPKTNEKKSFFLLDWLFAGLEKLKDGWSGFLGLFKRNHFDKNGLMVHEISRPRIKSFDDLIVDPKKQLDAARKEWLSKALQSLSASYGISMEAMPMIYVQPDGVKSLNRAQYVSNTHSIDLFNIKELDVDNPYRFFRTLAHEMSHAKDSLVVTFQFTPQERSEHLIQNAVERIKTGESDLTFSGIKEMGEGKNWTYVNTPRFPDAMKSDVQASLKKFLQEFETYAAIERPPGQPNSFFKPTLSDDGWALIRSMYSKHASAFKQLNGLKADKAEDKKAIAQLGLYFVAQLSRMKMLEGESFAIKDKNGNVTSAHATLMLSDDARAALKGYGDHIKIPKAEAIKTIQSMAAAVEGATRTTRDKSVLSTLDLFYYYASPTELNAEIRSCKVLLNWLINHPPVDKPKSWINQQVQRYKAALNMYQIKKDLHQNYLAYRSNFSSSERAAIQGRVKKLDQALKKIDFLKKDDEFGSAYRNSQEFSQRVCAQKPQKQAA